ncbi:PHB depolymerase family esterase [Xylanibacter muris]|uniref:PHB depolymerase family esterase n=1 Tax=Xylanibacter muris TaxID=2736290 RepID=UPI002585E752|nr:PHB depolymerase family esterase [Xylanibacter muris]
MATLLAAFVFFGNTGVKADNITVDGKSRNYLKYVPANLPENRPLLISCHGMNQDANYQKGQMAIEPLADKERFAVVFPNGINRAWDISGQSDINFILKLIDEMVALHKIDRDRVYLSGFSMGGMFTYHCMNNIADRIAAFAPISGYPMWGASANASRPVPLIHTHGTGDDVCTFDKVQGVLDVWIKFNKCNTTPSVTPNYKGAGHATYRRWSGGTNGVEVVLLEFAGKGHWVSNDVVKTGEEIWNFCSRYSLVDRNPKVNVTEPVSGTDVYYDNEGSKADSIHLAADVWSDYGDIVKVAFYGGSTLIKELTEPPYECWWFGVGRGQRIVRVVATDDKGRTGSAHSIFNLLKNTSDISGISSGCASGERSVYDVSGKSVSPSSSGLKIIVEGDMTEGKKVRKVFVR